MTKPIEILLVEGDPADKLVATDSLQRAKIINRVHTVSDGEEALAFLRREKTFQNAPPPAVILLALNLQRKDGREVLAEIKADPDLKRIPIIVLAASKTDEDVLATYAIPAICFLTKPVDATKLINVFNALDAFWYAVVGLSPGAAGEKQTTEPLPPSMEKQQFTQLASTIAHDFNNVLMVIQGFARELTASGETLGPATEILNATIRAEALTRQLLAYSRRDTAQMAEVNLNALVTDCARILNQPLPKNIQLAIQCENDLPLMQGDVGMIEQIIFNLIVNARDAMPSGGKLTLSTGLDKADDAQTTEQPGAAPGEFIFLSVSDTGIGIPPEILPRIFEPFVTTKGGGQRTGLGLATVQGIVKQHGGWINVSSKPGEGTTFRVYLPAAKIAAAAKGKRGGPKVIMPRGTETILVVEDEFHIRALVTSILRRFGYTVLAASQGAEASQVWAEHRNSIHLLFTDLMMPGGVSGREVAEKLQADKPELKVILTSGYSPEVFGENANPIMEGQIFLQKPYSPDVLLQLVRKTLDSN